MDNCDVAVLNKVNELAARHGIKPFDFVATFRTQSDKDDAPFMLHYESPPFNEELWPRYQRMLKDVGVSEGGTLVGSEQDIYEALERAIEVAPPVGRRR